MNKKIILSLSVIGVVAAIVIGGTYAYFSQTITAKGNTFSAGTMTMTLNEKSDSLLGPALYAKNLYPGAFAQSAAVIANGSSGIAFNTEISLANAVEGVSGMADYLHLEIWTNGKLWYRDGIKNFPGYTSGKLVLDTIQPGNNQIVAFRLIMVEAAPNELQGKDYSVNVVVTAHQWNNPDYQPSIPVEVNTTGYVASNWSYPVCGVRQPNFWTPLLATDTYVARSYDYTKYSPFFSYRVDSPMVDTNSKWMIHAPGSTSYAGGETVVNGPEVGGVYCTVK